MSKQSRRGPEWDATRKRILDRDGWICAYCGKDLTAEPRDATVDHIIAVDLGGTDDDSNLVASCRRDNGIKSNKMMIRMPWFNPRWLPEGLPA